MATKYSYTDAELFDIETNTMNTLEMNMFANEAHEDALQCILLLVDDLQEARKRIKELEKK